MAALSVRHVTPAFRTYAGDRALAAVKKELERGGVKRALLVHGASMQKNQAVMERVEAEFGELIVARFTGVREQSPTTSVESARDMVVDSGAQAILVLGGGSAVVTSRAAAILAGEGGEVRELCTRRGDDGKLISPRLLAPKLPQWVIPSTPTTAFAKAGAAVRDLDTGERMALFDPKARAAGVGFDPVVAATAPGWLVRSSALSALAVAVDGLQSLQEDPLSQAQLRQALVVFRDWLPEVPAGDEPVDGGVGVRLMFGALLAGQGSDHSSTGLAQALSHALGPRSTVGNGVVEALLLPHTMQFNLGVTDTGLTAVAEILIGAIGADPRAAIDAVGGLLARLEAPLRLRDVGIDREVFPAVVEHALNDFASTTVPRRAEREELAALLESAW
jgi:alcohol dehydrogenase class IV